MFAAATSFFARTNISQSYNIGSSSSTAFGSRPSTPSTSSLGPPPPSTPAFFVGLWKVQSAWHKVTSKHVSVWTFDKRGPDVERLGPQAKERAIEVMKAEASALGRLRHPSILEMVEPLEETRSEIVFATEPVLASLQLAISNPNTVVELDEIEIQKGVLQLCKGLSFLHTSAKLIHSNLSPESILINAAGDWKISGLGLTIPLQSASGGATRWEFPTFDGRVPPSVQRSFDYMAPEYALDEQLVTASDMYSLGCVLYAVHSKGDPPFKTHGSLGALRDNASKPLLGIERLDSDLQVLLRSLITRHYGSRPTPESLPSHPFFSSLPISTLNFLDRSNFTAKTREEKISFMKGLTTVLDRFSEGLRTRKILPSLLEEMKDTQLLPYILPNVFVISQSLSSVQFAAKVLPSLKPLFSVREPPQNMLTLLDNLTMLQEKTDKNVFREHVLPLVYNALESEHAVVQERALKAVPGLCDTIDYAEVQGVLFPRVAVCPMSSYSSKHCVDIAIRPKLVFTKTRILSVKVATLVTFLAMVKTLDQSSLTQKLVPLLSKIRTKEPAVMMATLSVHEAMGFKVDREAVATLVLPQLWAMSIGPLLSVGQFQRFMQVIKKLGDRVEKEHDQFLRDSQRLEDRSGIAPADTGSNGVSLNVDFESLVGRSGLGATVKADTVIDNNATGWDDVWGSIFSSNTTSVPAAPLSPSIAPQKTSSPAITTPASQTLATQPPLHSRSTNAESPHASTIPASSSRSQRQGSLNAQTPFMGASSNITRSAPLHTPLPPPPKLQPPANYSIPSKLPVPTQFQATFSSPNYEIYSAQGNQPRNHQHLSRFNSSQAMPTMPQHPGSVPAAPPLPQLDGILTPAKPATSSVGQANKLSKDDWGDFDPLS
ncbi:hypothetical protein CVT26_009832 [Gymnopilus dilepis]|uniref:Protein kinase domain-containing protein n=1 Tax=Gymnopilus dilepis TaxID=231916 RepID=A0A409VKV7_9AGAR|nr:hypothetical protein CVT26_009832 [Gymnopilus dilepis]